MRVPCTAHDKPTTHNMTATDMVEIIKLFQEGELQTMTARGVEMHCILSEQRKASDRF